MTDDTIKFIVGTVTASVKASIEPSLIRIHDRIDSGFSDVHGRITTLSNETAAMSALMSQMPTLDDQSREIKKHHDVCYNRRRWWIGFFIVLPPTVVAILAIANLFT